MKKVERILKEDVANFLLEQNKEKIVLVSSISNNLEYYYSILKQKNTDYEIKYINLVSSSEVDVIGANIEIIEFLNSSKKTILFIDINLALKVFFDKVDKLHLEKDKEYDRDEIVKFLVDSGYTKEYIIDKKTNFSIRGDIIDIYPTNVDNPIRLDFFDTVLEQIKEFSSYDQRSLNSLDSIDIFSNKLNGKEKEITQLAKDNASIYLENIELLEIKLEQSIAFDSNVAEIFKQRFKNLVDNASILEVSKNENRNYREEIKHKKENLTRKGVRYANINQILEGDYVIHIEFGIGIYRGLVNINERDYLYIQYADNDRLYIPVEKLDRISKYVSSNQAPELYSLGTKGFKRKEKKLKENVEKFAKTLIEIQAKRKLIKKLPYIKDTVFQEQFEEKFPFNLTADQKKSIDEIKDDLESGRLMDRLLIGDVGYGKTEVALRTIFKTIENGYQAVLLAPTTVLANQHYERCHKRFEDFGIRVANLSRLTGKNTKQVISEIKDGQIDLIIGTHKVLGDDVKFKNLGLLVVDEEQKFGVSAKEKIKTKVENIHLLTLSATPIPRTLNLALLGIRDISVISQSPLDRLPIITRKIEDNEIRSVILKELTRDGQVFYITNNVKYMEEKKRQIKKILPNFVNVEYIHGQLTPKEIKSKINDFDEGKIDILIASTIIENGIDVTNANSIIIEQYTHLGLSQIYQLRGRVGRGKRQGYCYLLESEFKTKKGKEKDKSLEKIEGVEGAGYILSLEDLNIRGSGEILGEKQHGVIDFFGYDLYIKMLKDEMNRLRGEKSLELKNTEIALKDNGYIPPEYIEKNERIVIYKRYAEVTSRLELDELNDEVRDRFGKMPLSMKKFIESIKVKLYMLENGIDRIEEENNKYILILNNNKIVLLRPEFLKRIR